MGIVSDLLFSLKPRCPHCRQGKLFQPFSVALVEKCAHCGKPLAKNDVGDGASVFLIFLLGFLLVPLAWGFEKTFSPPLWVHGVVFGLVALVLIAVILPATKAYIILLESRHR